MTPLMVQLRFINWKHTVAEFGTLSFPYVDVTDPVNKPVDYLSNVGIDTDHIVSIEVCEALVMKYGVHNEHTTSFFGKKKITKTNKLMEVTDQKFTYYRLRMVNGDTFHTTTRITK